MREPRPCAHGPGTLPARSAQAHLHHRFDSNVNWLAVAVQARRSALAPYPSARCAAVPVPSGVWRYISPFCALCGRVRSSRTPRSSAPTRPTSSCAPASLWRLSPRAPAAKSRHRRPRLDPSLAPGAWRLAVPPSPLAPTRRPHPPWHPPGRQARLLQLHGPARLWWRPVAPPRAARRHHVRRRPRWLHRRRQPRCSPPTRTLR